jgi:hypothetical protein
MASQRVDRFICLLGGIRRLLRRAGNSASPYQNQYEPGRQSGCSRAMLDRPADGGSPNRRARTACSGRLVPWSAAPEEPSTGLPGRSRMEAWIRLDCWRSWGSRSGSCTSPVGTVRGLRSPPSRVTSAVTARIHGPTVSRNRTSHATGTPVARRRAAAAGRHLAPSLTMATCGSSRSRPRSER